MPQLDFAIYISQIFWLFIIFYSFYYIVLKHLLPTISEILKVRTSKLQLSSQGENDLKSEEIILATNYNELVINSMRVGREILTDFVKESTSWVNSKTYELNNVYLKGLNMDYLNSILILNARKQLIKQAINS